MQDLFDQALFAHRRDRALALGFDGGADFLHRAVADSLGERLSAVRRDFHDVVVVGTQGGIVPAALAGQLAGATFRLFDPSPGIADRSGAIWYAGETMPIGEGCADLVISSLLLHHLNDPVGHLIQLRRALRSDGLLLVASFGGQTLVELRSAFAEAESRLMGGLTPRVSPMAEIRDLGGLLQRAGFALPVADSEPIRVSYPTALHLMRDLRAMGETNVLVSRSRKPTGRKIFDLSTEIYREHFASGDGVRASFDLIFLTGWAPAPGQQKALRPGSAATRLAEALDTFEVPAGEKAGPDG
ncbi:MAG: methyltransferase domain-containing protein [Pseudomonadota bacterium]